MRAMQAMHREHSGYRRGGLRWKVANKRKSQDQIKNRPDQTSDRGERRSQGWTRMMQYDKTTDEMLCARDRHSAADEPFFVQFVDEFAILSNSLDVTTLHYRISGKRNVGVIDSQTGEEASAGVQQSSRAGSGLGSTLKTRQSVFLFFFLFSFFLFFFPFFGLLVLTWNSDSGDLRGSGCQKPKTNRWLLVAKLSLAENVDSAFCSMERRRE
ncbi:hypothetical protein BZA70DRAFT_116484 [Myxozyma melibiosi]|uniref:Uncharacterized protein n=1 Tax=Myxozyma melibiosi TaxID=54550 RepID=A0ABR1FAK0_9ASCO